MSKVCTGDAGYITAPEQCAEQSVTPAAPADMTMFELFGFDYDNPAEGGDDCER